MIEFLMTCDGIDFLFSALGIIGTAILTAFFAHRRYRIKNLHSEVGRLIKKIKGISDTGISYYSESGTQDLKHEAVLERDMHQIAVESTRINRRYQVFPEDKLKKYNANLWRAVTNDTIRNPRPDRSNARKIGSISNLYESFCRQHLDKRTGFIDRIAAFYATLE